MSNAPSGKDLHRWRLPRGRHGLPREVVERSQRERLLAAIVRVAAAKGYEDTSVADVLEEAGVGRETFYELFDDKRDCLVAAHTILIEDLEEAVGDAYLGEAPWEERFRAGLAAMLRWFASDPAATKTIMLEVSMIGPVSREIFQADIERFTRLVERGLDGGREPALPGAAGLAVGAVFARVLEEALRDRVAALPDLAPELTYELLVPFVGEQAAAEQRQRAEEEPAG